MTIKDCNTSSTCSVEACGDRAHAFGYCSSHYHRFKKYNDPVATPLKPKLSEFAKHRELFNSVVSGHIESEDCIIWTGKPTPQGYGCLSIKNRTRKVHTWVLALTKGEAEQSSMDAAHSCHVRNCINPKHLSWKSKQENVDDKMQAVSAAKRLSKKKAMEIYKSSDDYSQLASDYCVSETTIYDIKAGRTWAWVTGHLSQSA